MIRVRVLTYVAAAAVFAAIIAGCNSGSNTVNVAPCGTPAGMQAQLIYPAPGSTAIPDNVSQIIVATNGTLPADWQTGNGWDVLLAYNFNPAYGNGHYGNMFAAAATPFPSPAATPSFANPTYYSSTISYTNAPNLPPATQVTVQLNDLNSTCYPGITIGTFTTQ
jgi:hypothetical protein